MSLERLTASLYSADAHFDIVTHKLSAGYAGHVEHVLLRSYNLMIDGMTSSLL